MKNEPIQVVIGAVAANGVGPITFWLHDEGVKMGELCDEDVRLAIAVFRDLADALEMRHSAHAELVDQPTAPR